MTSHRITRRSPCSPSPPLSAVVLQRVAPPTSLLFPLPLTTLAATTPLSGCTAESCSSLLFPLPLSSPLPSPPLPPHHPSSGLQQLMAGVQEPHAPHLKQPRRTCYTVRKWCLPGACPTQPACECMGKWSTVCSPRYPKDDNDREHSNLDYSALPRT